MISNAHIAGAILKNGNPAHKKGRTRKVLVIDDSTEIRMIIGETLELFGFDTMITGDGMSGVQMAREQFPDVIICDINMPGLDGYGTLKAMREHEGTATIPFVFLSGSVDRVAVRKGMELGADDYLTKPFTPQELLAAVNARLEKQDEIQRHSNRKLDELRGNLTLALPHELRTPLNGIMGLAHLMMEEPPARSLSSISRALSGDAMSRYSCSGILFSKSIFGASTGCESVMTDITRFFVAFSSPKISMVLL